MFSIDFVVSNGALFWLLQLQKKPPPLTRAEGVVFNQRADELANQLAAATAGDNANQTEGGEYHRGRLGNYLTIYDRKAKR